MGSATSTWPSRRSSTSSCRVKSSKQKKILFFFFEKIKIKISFRIFVHSEKKNHPHHQNFEISFHRFFCFLYKHEQLRPQHSSLCIYFVSSVQHVIILICRRKKNYPVCLFHELFLIFLVSFLRTDLILLPPPILFSFLFVLEKNSIFVRI